MEGTSMAGERISACMKRVKVEASAIAYIERVKAKAKTKSRPSDPNPS